MPVGMPVDLLMDVTNLVLSDKGRARLLSAPGFPKGPTDKGDDLARKIAREMKDRACEMRKCGKTVDTLDWRTIKDILRQEGKHRQESMIALFRHFRFELENDDAYKLDEEAILVTATDRITYVHNPFTAQDEAYQNASEEILCYSMTLHWKSIYQRRPHKIDDILLNRLRAGVKVKYLVLNPFGKHLSIMARATNVPKKQLMDEAKFAAEILLGLSDRWEQETKNDTQRRADANGEPLLSLQWFDSITHCWVYITDPLTYASTNGNNESGKARELGRLIFTPYMYGLWPVPPSLPTLSLDPSQGAGRIYLQELRRILQDKRHVGPEQIREQMGR